MEKKFKKSIVWFRRDLRLSDHTALAQACAASEKVACVFIFDKEILNSLADYDDRRVCFIHECLKELDLKLKELGSELIVRYGIPLEAIPKIANTLKAEAVFVNRDYEPSAKKRDDDVKEALYKQGISFFDFKDQVVFERREILNKSQEPFKVFTPYKNAWLKKLSEEPSRFSEEEIDFSKFISRAELKKVIEIWSITRMGFKENKIWLKPGEAAAKVRLENFIKNSINDYTEDRNFPFLAEGTSGLSVHLRFGTISIRECVREILKKKKDLLTTKTESGEITWLSELIWREFYQMLLDQNARLAQGKCFQSECDEIKWPGTDEHFQAWCQGKTGYPLVDAAMRHFNQTGWMHNRLRMVVASFLTKDLLVDWRKGEAYFAEKLLDYDFAANNGGWQWSASVGCDAQPYFRIFNPISQSEKFDPKGTFIKSAIPELKALSEKDIHWPHDLGLFKKTIDYPAPIVDHDIQRKKTLTLFKNSSLTKS